ncbi:MAG: EamA family transporter [Thermodesulfobacteriota bacterium]
MTPISILLILISALIHSSWNFFTKRGNFSIKFFFWVFLWGSLLYLPFFIGFNVLQSLTKNLSGNLLGLMILSGFFETLYFICLIEAYKRGDLSLVYPLSRSAPLFTQIWAFSFIGETLSSIGMIGILLVMVGLYIIPQKGFSLKYLPFRSERFMMRPSLLAISAAMASSIYSVIDKVGVQYIPPVFYLWWINLFMTIQTGIYLFFRKEKSLWEVWKESKKEILIISVLQNAAYLLVLIALTMSKVSYVVAFRQVGALFGALMGILFLKEEDWKIRLTGALILTSGLIMVGFAK